MSTVVRVRRRLQSSTLDVPELAELIGKDVEIVVTEVREPVPDSAEERYELRGSVLKYEDPFGPAVPEEDWDALK
ncbi:MAG: hypothetical protein AB7J35_19030 [Dehalococcoidia bacterium]